jgi:hypothetical protein
MFRFGLKFVSVAALCGVLLVNASAVAQTIKVSGATFKIKRKIPRSTGEFPYLINYDDCINSFAEMEEDRTEIQIRPVISGWDRNQDRLEVWVSGSQDCKSNTERTQTGRCRQLAAKLATATNELLTIRPADVVAAIYKPGNEVTVEADESVCDSRLSSNALFHIMFISTGDVQGQVAVWKDTQVDVAPPSVPDNLRVLLGDEALFPRWDAVTDADINGFNVFCEQVSCTPGAVPLPDTGAAGAAGSPGVIDASCVSGPSVLLPGKRLSPAEVNEYRCASSTGRAASEATVSGAQGSSLENGNCYAIAVASKDNHSNLSALSDVACGTPKDVITFYDGYSNAGGKGGGQGFCQMSPGGAGSALAGMGALIALLGRARTRGSRARRNRR